jgi:hypothetical protein
MLRVAEAKAQGKKLPPENLLIIAENSMAMAARYEPGTKEKPNENYDEERYAFWLSAAREANKAAAPYYAPRLHAIAVQTVPSIEGKGEESRVDPRQLLLEMYFKMRERGEIALTALPAPGPKRSGNGSVVEPAKVEEDDADGVAA